MKTEGKMRTFTSLTLLCLLFAVSEAFAYEEVSALLTFKEAIYEDPGMILSGWNSLASDPCEWNGVYCDGARDHVRKINISAAAMRGFIAPELGKLEFLEELILHGNKLLGSIPKELSLLKNLRVLDLGKNEITGPIPPEIGKLSGVVKINLGANGLTGHVPSELGNLKSLQELRLDRNRLQGTLPASGMTTSNATGFCRLSRLKTADFSYNFFVGSIPKCLQSLPKTSFQGNCLQHEDVKQRSKKQCDGNSLVKARPEVSPKHRAPKSESGHSGNSKPTWLLALEIVTGIMVGSLFLIALLTAFHRCNSKSSLIIPWKKSATEKEHVAVHIDSEMLKDVVRYNRQDLEVACEDFSNIIGSSPDSMVYKGTVRGGPEIAVISLCIKEENWTGFLELYYQREVVDLARLDHENVGKLLGYCRESVPFTRMLVLEYASNGTLYEHLHYGEGCQLSWTRRMKIVIGIARGLKYLHSELEPPFTISELNSSAVYLTEDFSPKLVDFECWKAILARSEKYSGSFDSQGSVCVLPNSLEARYLDIQGNLYAFGVLLLEIISGRPPYCKDKGCLVDWAKEYLELPEVMPNVVDPELKNFKHDDLKVICRVASLCLHPDPTERPLMHVLSEMLESGIDTTFAVDLKSSSLAWAELALSSL